MTTYGIGQIGTWIDYKTGVGYSGPKRNPYDIPASPETGEPIKPSPQASQKVVSPYQTIDASEIIGTSPMNKVVPKTTAFDIKIPTAYKTSTEATIDRDIPNLLSTIKSIQESIAQSGGSVGLTITSPFTGKTEITSEELRPGFERNLKELIFGKEPIKSLQTRVAETELTLKEKGLPIIGKTKLTEKGALPLALVGVGATVGLDFTGWGAGKNEVVKILAKTSKVEDVAKILRKMNVAEDLVSDYSKVISKLDKTEDVSKALNRIEEIQKTTKSTPKTALKIGEVASEVSKPKAKGFQWAERGFIKSVKEELPDLATKPLGEEVRISGQYVPRSTDRLAIRAKNLIQTDIKTAEKIAQTGTDDNSVAIGVELLKHYSDEALKSSSEAVRDALYSKAADLANDMARRLTEQGRSIQATSILGRLTPEGQLKFAAREIQKYNEEISKTRGGIFGLQKKIPELTKEQSKEIITEMKEIQKMAEGTEKAARFQKLQNYITDLVPTPLFRKMIAVWKAGLLTGIKTSGLNIFANVSHVATETIKDIPAEMVDKIVSLFTKKRTVSFGIKGLLTGAKEGLSRGQKYLITGFDERNIGTKLDYYRINFGKGKLARALQKYTDTIFRIMGTEDQPFYYAAKLRSLYEQAKVGAINKGLKGSEAQKFIDNLIQNPTEEMVKYASYDAETVVFQNKTALGSAARSIQKIGGGVGEFIVPFGRTPSAVAMQIFNYSPVGIAKTIFENTGKGRFDQRLFSQGLGRGLTGTAALALGSLLFKKGIMTLSRPSGEKEQKLWELEGKTANAIKIGNKWRTVQALGPVGNVLLIGGYFQQEFSKSGSPTEAITNVLAGASKSFTQQTFLTGVSNFIDAISDPARSAEYVAGSTLASSIPTIISDIGRATDEKERRANSILDKFQARIPGIREKLEPVITVLGEEKARIGNPLEVMIDPTRPSPEKTNQVTQELRRLWDIGIKVSPTLLGDKNGYPGLTSKQNTELWKNAGEITYEKLSNLIKNETYQKMPDDKKGKIIEDFVDKSKTIARVSIVMELTKDLQGEDLKKKLSELKKSGLMTREIFDKYIQLK